MKVVITTIPFIDENSPLSAPAVLKAALQQHNISCTALDLNIEVYNKLKNHPNRQKFIDFFWKQIIHEEIVDELSSMLRFYSEEILSHRPDIVGLSLFSRECQVFAAWLGAYLKHRAPEIKIVIGGPGLETLQGSIFKYPDRLRQLGLIDDYITGDAEKSLVEYVKNHTDYPGINSTDWKPYPNRNDLPIPDYSDYRFFRYDNVLLPIVDSRGCVQNCEFCDVIAFWNKFQSLTADNIFSQIKTHIRNHGIYRFQFASSICNGNLKEFRKLMRLIADYNNSVNDTEQIHWVGSFIVRPASHHPEDLWKLMKDSNGLLLTGVESIIERVRIRLGKKFTNADLDHHLEMGKKYNVPMNLLIIASYPTETADDYEECKQWFIDHKQYANDSVRQVQLSLPAILAGTELEKTIDIDRFYEGAKAREQHARALYNTVKECGFNLRPMFSV